MQKRVFELLNQNKKINVNLFKTNVKLEAFGGSTIEHMGFIKAKCLCQNTNFNLKFIIAGANVTPILGLNGCVDLDLVERIGEIRASTREE